LPVLWREREASRIDIPMCNSSAAHVERNQIHTGLSGNRPKVVRLTESSTEAAEIADKGSEVLTVQTALMNQANESDPNQAFDSLHERWDDETTEAMPGSKVIREALRREASDRDE